MSRNVDILLFSILFAISGCGGSSPRRPGGGACTPMCTGRNCGSDGCGGTCGTCQQGYSCGADGLCVSGGGCTPQCNSKLCGSDGCGGSCGDCKAGFKCNNIGSCDLDPSALWNLTVTSGTVSERDPNGSAWDVPGGLPDAFVCLTINGQRSCTSTANDTLRPAWNEVFVGSAAALQAGVIVELWDEDLSSNDVICSKGTVTVAADDFLLGQWGAKCTYGSFSATLRVR